MSTPDRHDDRRSAIIDAAMHVIAEVGAGRATHRLIAERADVPLGSTTYHFADRGELVAAGLERAARLAADDLVRWRALLDTCGTPDELAARLAELAHAYVGDDRTRAVSEYELYLAATRHPELRDVARTWIEALRATVGAHTGAETARAVVSLLDGAMLQALVLERPIDVGELTGAVLAVLAADTSDPTDVARHDASEADTGPDPDILARSDGGVEADAGSGADDGGTA